MNKIVARNLTTEVFCHDANPVHHSMPCQAGYGSYSVADPPQCSEDSRSSRGRTVGYYQSWNVRQREHNTLTPKQLNTKGFEHLFYSSAFIDPNGFSVVPAHDHDVEMMKEFTSLSKAGKLQTWIAIGGFDFSDPEKPAQTTWSDMVTKANHAKFTASLELYMQTYGLQGVDFDREYPGTQREVVTNLLTRETSLCCVTLAPDYWYLRRFDAEAFFGFKAYGKTIWRRLINAKLG
ncbi:hypothetical protein KCU65_g9982, partial [Aureobasidium melanogenum]